MGSCESLNESKTYKQKSKHSYRYDDNKIYNHNNLKQYEKDSNIRYNRQIRTDSDNSNSNNIEKNLIETQISQESINSQENSLFYPSPNNPSQFLLYQNQSRNTLTKFNDTLNNNNNNSTSLFYKNFNYNLNSSSEYYGTKMSLNTNTFDSIYASYIKNIRNFPYYCFNDLQTNQYENQYYMFKSTSQLQCQSKSPIYFIQLNQRQGENYELFSKIYQICYLRNESLINNITENKEIGDFLYLRTVIILLSKEKLPNKIDDIANRIALASYDSNNKCFYLEQLSSIIKSYCEICINIIFYFGIILKFISLSEYSQSLQNENYLIDDCYNCFQLSDYVIRNLTNSCEDFPIDNICFKWVRYISYNKLGKIHLNLNKNNNKSNNNNNHFFDNNEQDDENDDFDLVKAKIKYMINAEVLLKSIMGMKVFI